jgi:hypothetical protein
VSRFDDRIRRDLGDRATGFHPSVDLETRIDDAITRWEHRARVATVTTTAVLTLAVLLILAAFVVHPGGGDREATRVANHGPAGTTPWSDTADRDSAQSPPPGAAPAPSAGARPAPRSDRSDRSDPADPSSAPRIDRSAPAAGGSSSSTAPPADATPPAITAISITPPDTDGVCTASWTADDGGTPIKEYVVSKATPVVAPDAEPAPATPAEATPTPPGDEVPTEKVDEKTKDAFTDAPVGSTLTVTARNAVGISEPTDEVVCAE